MLRWTPLIALVAALACSSSKAPSGSGGAPSSTAGSTASSTSGDPLADGGDAGASDAADDAPDDAPEDAADDANDGGSDDAGKAAPCAATFGSSLTNAFGRLDGTVLAIVPPDDQTCAMPNSTHLVIQVVWEGAAYRMVLDVLSSSGDPDVFFYEANFPLAAGPWSEGWHPNVALDYVNTLAVHATQFTSMVEADLVEKVTSEITLGAPISVFATSAGEPSSAHLIHRNETNQDGAIVLDPQGASPHYLLFRFSDQSF